MWLQSVCSLSLAFARRPVKRPIFQSLAAHFEHCMHDQHFCQKCIAAATRQAMRETPEGLHSAAKFGFVYLIGGVKMQIETGKG